MLERVNEDQFGVLAGKLSQLRGVAEDIRGGVAQEESVLSGLGEALERLGGGVREASGRLGRAMASGRGVWRNVGVGLVGVVVIWMVWSVAAR